MTKIIVVPGQNVFNRNYRGSSCYCRYSSVIIRQKRIPKRDVLPKVSITRFFLKKSSLLWTDLNIEEKQTFIDYASSNPKYKSGINVMAGSNIRVNYAMPLCYSLVRSLGIDPIIPEVPYIYYIGQSDEYKFFRMGCSTSYENEVKIRIWYFLNNLWTYPKESYFSYLGFFKSTDPYIQISFIPYENFKTIWIRGTAQGINGLESQFDMTIAIGIV